VLVERRTEVAVEVMILGQTPDPTDVMEAAKATQSWTVVLLCFLVLTMVGGVVMLFKLLRDSYAKQVQSLNQTAGALKSENDQRESRFVERITKLENEQFSVIMAMNEKLTALIAETTAVLKQFTAAQTEINGDLKELIVRLDSSPCVVNRMRDIKVVDAKTGEDLTQ